MSKIILKLGAEGGSITVYGVQDENDSWQFWVKKNEVVLCEIEPELEWGQGVATESLNSWNEVVNLLNKNPTWYRLCPMTVHPEFKQVILALVEELGGTDDVTRWLRNLDAEMHFSVDASNRILS